ncbi:uncharacterized protein LOC144363045 [Saccoglossus kowalevskii]
MEEVKESNGMYGVILVSKKFITNISENNNVKKSIEEQLRQDIKLETKYALVLMTDVDTKLLHETFPSLTIRGIHAVNYRSYQTEIRALAEAVYKTWFGCNVFIDRANICATSNEASMTVQKDPVENDETLILDTEVVSGESNDDSSVDQVSRDLSSLSTQSDGCQHVQTAQELVSVTPEAATADTEESNNTTTEDDAASQSIGTVPVVKDEDIKTPVEEASLGEVKKHPCNQHDCHSKEEIYPAENFYDSTRITPISRELSVKDFKVEVRDELMYILDPPLACVKDWRHLASLKNVPNNKIKYWETQRSGTLAFLDYVGATDSGYTVAEFKKDLKHIQRMDVLDLLEKCGY